MKLQTPFGIGSRLLPALRVGNAELSLEFVGCADNRMVFRWYIDLDGEEYSDSDLKSGIQGCTTQAMFGSFLAFLGACGEAYSYPGPTENMDLFPIAVAEWAAQYCDELAMLQQEIESTPNLIEE